MALVHDLAESLVGDITPDSGIAKAEKHRQEAVSFSAGCMASTSPGAASFSLNLMFNLHQMP
jgi:hypothetical protein